MCFYVTLAGKNRGIGMERLWCLVILGVGRMCFGQECRAPRLGQNDMLLAQYNSAVTLPFLDSLYIPFIHAHAISTDTIMTGSLNVSSVDFENLLQDIVMTMTAGLISSDDKIKLDQATSLNVADTLVMRDDNGVIYAQQLTAPVIVGNVMGNIVGNMVGNVNGNVVGTVLGSVIGDVQGDVVGNLMGNEVTVAKINTYALKIGSMNGILQAQDGTVSTLGTVSMPGIADQSGCSLRMVTGQIAWLRHPLDPRYESFFFDDFRGRALPYSDMFGWVVSLGSTDDTDAVLTRGIGSVHNELGYIVLSTGSTVGGVCSIVRSPTAYRFGMGPVYGSCRIMVPVLATDQESYVVRIGYGDQIDANDFMNGVYVEYDYAQSGNVWRLKTAQDGIRTMVVSEATISNDQYHTLAWQINDNGTYVDFYDNDIMIGTITTTIPTVSGDESGPSVIIYKTTGACACTVQLDYWYDYVFYTRAR
jgi:uncharacterized protein YcfJ